MTKIKLPYVKVYRDRHGRVRRYFRRRGCPDVALSGSPGSPEFMAAYQRALDLARPMEIGATRTKPGTIDALIVDYLKSDAFTKALAPETQRMRRNILDRFRTDHGAKRVVTLERRHVAKLLERRPPYAQKNWLPTRAEQSAGWFFTTAPRPAFSVRSPGARRRRGGGHE